MTQLGIWLAAMAAGGGDDDDKPFPFLNEEGRTTYVDLTPVSRALPWYKGDPTGKRRVYGRWGKQTWEVLDGWLTEPVNQLMRKLSQPAKWVLEQATGKSPGSDWNLEFQGQGLKGWLAVDREGVDAFLKSRAGYTITKFLPMSLLSAWENPDAAISALFTPVSKGMSLGKASQAMIEILNTYANEESWKQIKGNPRARANLDALAPGLLDAVKRNGYDPEKVIDTAKAVVLGRLYGQFFDAMNRGDMKRMDEMSIVILRVGGSLKGVSASMKQKTNQYNKPMTPEQQEMMRKAFD